MKNIHKVILLIGSVGIFNMSNNKSNNRNYNKTIPATEEDLYLYKSMGTSYLCIALKAEIDFNKALGVASATFVQILEGKHGGMIGNKKLNGKELYEFASLQIVGVALKACPDSIPENIKNEYKKLVQ